MSKIPFFSILVLALLLVTGRTQTPKPPGESELFRNFDPNGGDLLNTKPLTLLDEKPSAPREKSGNQTEITADNAEFNNKTHIAIFIGGVIVNNPEFNCNCDRLTAYLKHDDKPTPLPGDKAKPAAAPAEPAPATKGKGEC